MLATTPRPRAIFLRVYISRRLSSNRDSMGHGTVPELRRGEQAFPMRDLIYDLERLRLLVLADESAGLDE